MLLRRSLGLISFVDGRSLGWEFLFIGGVCGGSGKSLVRLPALLIGIRLRLCIGNSLNDTGSRVCSR